MRAKPILYIKRGCPWCREAVAWFQKHGVDIDLKDVNISRSNLQRMVEVSGQTLTPTMEYGDFVVADFSVDEFVDALSEAPEIRRELGIGDHLEDD
ncbi:glutaredoxin family protein [Rubellicoccus peritrichatus]|uniref:Glutaredoxin family protein n=1 Tax=Rubellicoccus peritrichatus TaxID=3080537 RepID=A0AAQ3LGJ9_9BACT|nr:glutaredoxin family protein [Puniceicoccus sp. CR14]WOO43423.1 glutaredoxin family protein [Puniceicoccus sp. CR14]